MLKNYLFVLFRNLWKRRTFSLINILGLSCGLACFSFIALYVAGERGYDQFHPGADRLYRVNKVVVTDDGGTEKHGLTAGLLAPELKAAFPEVEEATRLHPWFNPIRITLDGMTIISEQVAFADANFFNVFGYELVRGHPETALVEPMSMVLVESEAKALFGEVDPIGQQVKGLEDLNYVVTGIVRDPDSRSHFSFSGLISWSSTMVGTDGLGFDWMNRWITQAPFTYVRLTAGTDPKSLESKLPAFYKAQDPDRADRYELYLQPITQTYLNSADIRYVENTRRGNAGYVMALSVVAILVLLIASLNFVNLSTARMIMRYREVGIRKAFGARRAQLCGQFLMEAMFYSLIAFVLAALAVELFAQQMGRFSGQEHLTETGATVSIFGLMFGVALLVGFLSGLWPAFSLARIGIVRSLAGRTSTRRSVWARNSFVTFQFAVSMVLIAGSMVVVRQLDLLLSQDLGFNGEQLVVLQTDDTAIQSQYGAFKARIESHPSIIAATGSNSVPGSPTMTMNVRLQGMDPGDGLLANIVRIDDFDLIKTYGFEMAHGRFFDPAYPTDATGGVVINQTLANALNLEEPVGSRLDIPGELSEGTVLGVVEDFHFASLRESIEPLAFYYAPRGATVTVRIADGSVDQAISHMESVWNEFENGFPFDYSFLDETFARFYEREARLRMLLMLFAGVAIFIACLGLYGLASYMTATRTREVGIRKVLGANVSQIVRLFVREFAILVGAAVVIAVPIILIGANRWLEDFAYRIQVGAGTLLIAAGGVLLIAIVSASWHPIRAALADPVTALRSE